MLSVRRFFAFLQVMSGDAAAQTLRDSALRLNHRLRRFAGANALKKIALNVIAEVRPVGALINQPVGNATTTSLALHQRWCMARLWPQAEDVKTCSYSSTIPHVFVEGALCYSVLRTSQIPSRQHDLHVDAAMDTTSQIDTFHTNTVCTYLLLVCGRMLGTRMRVTFARFSTLWI